MNTTTHYGRLPASLNKKFSDYALDISTLTGRQQTRGLAFVELGQRWHFILTLRLSNTDALNTYNSTKLLHSLECYIEKVSRRTGKVRGKQCKFYRNVYLHRKPDKSFHAHIYGKYPKGGNFERFEALLEEEWVNLPLVGCNTDGINFHLLPCERQSLGWGKYGAYVNKRKGTEATAFVSDLSLPQFNYRKAHWEGKRILSASLRR